MADRIRVPGPRDVRATVDTPDADAAVVACPPHPQMGGDRRDPRLRAVGEALGERSIACIRFDYGPWDEGRGEQTDARSALAWARDRFHPVGLFGYSFGGAVALLAAASESDDGTPPAAVGVLAPASTLAGASAAAAVDAVEAPLRVLYGERDTTVDAAPVADRAREDGHTVETLPADHFFAGHHDRIGETFGVFFEATL